MDTIIAIGFWVVLCMFLIGSLIAMCGGINIINNNASNSVVGRMERRGARETEQWLFNDFVPFVLFVVFGIPALFIINFFVNLFGFDLVFKVLAWGFGIVCIGIPILIFLLVAFGLISNLFKKEEY